MSRPGSSSGRPGSRGGSKANTFGPGSRPIGTASRLMTGMAGHRAAPTAGGGVAIAAKVNVTDRPMTQQGLGGMKTGASRGPQRQVQDTTYFLGLLRSKINELHLEIVSLKGNQNVMSEDQSTFLTYEKRAEILAHDLKHLQNEMGDYNTLVDKLTTDESIADIQMDFEDLRSQNDKSAHGLDALFETRKQREEVVRSMDLELQQEKAMTDTLISSMDATTRLKYMEMSNLNERLLKQLEAGQQELDRLNNRKQGLENELAMSPVKQEAVRKYELLNGLEEKREVLVAENKARGTPREERERLLKQVKDNNQEIASMERQTNDIKDKMVGMGEEKLQLDMDIEENQGERNQKYKELRKREETMTEFLVAFETTIKQELDRRSLMQSNVVVMMEHISRNLKREDASMMGGRTAQDLTNMRDDLQVKEGEARKSKNTATGIAAEHEKLHQDFIKVEQLESKITQELDMLRQRVEKMNSELATYEDLNKLRVDGEKKKKQLGDNKVIYFRRRDHFKLLMEHMTEQYDGLKSQLAENETYTQLSNYERKWQHHEQNNFIMKEYIAGKQMETNYMGVAKKIKFQISEYNADLQKKMSEFGTT